MPIFESAVDNHLLWVKRLSEEQDGRVWEFLFLSLIFFSTVGVALQCCVESLVVSFRGQPRGHGSLLCAAGISEDIP